MRTRIGAFTLMGLMIARAVSALTGLVIDGRSRTPVANAEVSIVGQRGSARTGADGRFEWALPVVSPAVFVVIFPDGRVGRPIPVEGLDGANSVTLLVEVAVAESVDVSGTAPAIDISPGSSTAIVPAADVRIRHPATVGEILENIPGVGIISEGQSATPAIRGLARGRTVILVDGSRASSERRAGANASFLDPAIVDRVEVARGPGSVAYGSDAMGGVIAVRSRRPEYQRPLQVRFAGTAGAGVPEASGDVEMSAGYGTGGILAGVRVRDVDSYDSPYSPVPNSGWRDRGFRVRWEHGTESVWSIGWETDLARDIERPRSDSAVVRVTTPFEDSHRLTVSYGVESLAGFRHVRLDGLLGSVSQRTDQDRRPTPARPRRIDQSEVRSREIQLRATGDRTTRGARFQFGADVDARYGLESTDTGITYNGTGTVVTIESTPSIANAHRTDAGVFTQADVQGSRHLRLSGGLRGDVVHSANIGGYFGNRQITHSALAGAGAVSLVPAESLTLTVQVSRAFRDPMLSDRFYRGPVGRGVLEGNPDLEPETSLQLDALARYDTGHLVFSSALYDYRISNLIERYPSGSTSFTFRNRGGARIRGAELEARAMLPRRFVLTVSAQTSRGRDEDDGAPVDDIAPRSISLLARHTVRTVSSYLRVAAFASHDAAGPSEVPTPAYTLVDAGAAWRIGRRFQLAAVMRNLLNEAFYSSAGHRWVYAPGRRGSATVVIEF